VNDSALVLKYYTEDAATNIRKEAVRRGLSVHQDNTDLYFLPGAGAGEHIQRKAMCDLYLDVRIFCERG
jgi:predicted O-linked N-acetylglucosamine transferase (SPINDLY family)